MKNIMILTIIISYLISTFAIITNKKLKKQGPIAIFHSFVAHIFCLPFIYLVCKTLFIAHFNSFIIIPLLYIILFDIIIYLALSNNKYFNQHDWLQLIFLIVLTLYLPFIFICIIILP